MAVILDVVYNHLGPDGNYLAQFTDTYFTERNGTDWGDAINFDGEESDGVREFFIQNAGYWIDEFHFDGLRLDATQAIHDVLAGTSSTEIARQRPRAGGRTDTIVVAENDPQDMRSCGRPTTAATASTASGTTTFTTARSWR